MAQFSVLGRPFGTRPSLRDMLTMENQLNLLYHTVVSSCFPLVEILERNVEHIHTTACATVAAALAQEAEAPSPGVGAEPGCTIL